MEKLDQKDLMQISSASLEKLGKSDLIDLSLRLRNQLCDALEKLNQDSSNSSKPPSSDNPFNKKSSSKEDKEESEKESEQNEHGEDPDRESDKKANNDPEKRNPGKQPGAKGFWRTKKPVAETREHHYPEKCIICGRKLEEDMSAYSGFYTFELERKENGIDISCTLHTYYSCICLCGHENIAKPGEGYISFIEGRKRNLQLKEYNLVGPMLATFIAALNRRHGMSRKKIEEFLLYWLNFELSAGTICKCIREAGIACYPVVDRLIEELREENIVNMDETPWYQKGKMLWLWVAVSAQVAVYHIGTRKKEELLKLITEAFIGWLITDGYLAYRHYEYRQRCLAHLIRKAVALSGALNQQARNMGDWLLRELRGLIKAMADGGDGKKESGPILARLKRACNLGSESDHAKLKSLAREILNDWDAVVAFVKNPELPATNNEAERALRQAVIFRKITFGTRTNEGSYSYAAFLSVVETCRLRNLDPWDYISKVVAYGRKGIAPPVLNSY
jgi:IS1 family transposase